MKVSNAGIVQTPAPLWRRFFFRISPSDLAGFALLIAVVLIALYSVSDYTVPGDEGAQHHDGFRIRYVRAP